MKEVIVLVILALSAFYYFNYRMRVRREDRIERLTEKREKYMSDLLDQLGKRKVDPTTSRTENNTD